MINLPSIGDEVLDPNEKFSDLKGINKFDLLLCDGSVLDAEKYPLLAEKLPTQSYDEVGTLTASDAEANDYFGWSCAVYGDRLVVGANEDTAGINAGKVYIYDWNENTQSYDEVGTLTASDAEDNDYFGASCAVYGDRLVVGATDEDTAASDGGKVYIYDWNGTNYVEVGVLTASDAADSDYFGGSCAIHGDRLVVGANVEGTVGINAGQVYIYDWNENTQSYDEVGTLTASDVQSGDRFGASCSVYGDRLVVGATFEDTAGINAGKVYIYDWNGTNYDEVGTLTASDAEGYDFFGAACAVYGDRLVVGATFEDTAGNAAGKVYIYDWNGTNYDEVGTLTASDAQSDDYFGASCAVYGDRLVVGAIYGDTVVINAGKVYYYGTSVTTLLPDMTSKDPLCPYRIVADKYTPSIGEIRPSNQEKYMENGMDMFDNLLCDGSTYSEITYPMLYLALGDNLEVILDKDTTASGYWGVSTSVAANRDGSIVYVSSNLSTIWKSTDSGDTYSQIKEFYGNSYTEAIDCSSDGSVVYVFVYNGSNYDLQKSSDSGDTWSDLLVSVAGVGRSVCCSSDGSIVYIGSTTGNTLFKSIDGGLSFIQVGTDSVIAFTHSLCCSADGEIVYVCNAVSSSALSKSIDGGVTFSTIGISLIGWSISCDESGDYLLIGGTGRSYFSEDGGATYYSIGLLVSNVPNRVALGNDGKRGYVVTVNSPDSDMGIVVASQKLPTNTSTYPSFPDRVIADLTEGDL